ncbi:hypothetical protein B0H10DRAFT_2097705 [Mycena sp. CBHHK59/15]|nr:hypothetical protein B0H10DRAFT_2097705 [Mycena sp. CBHHK59/15]
MAPFSKPETVLKQAEGLRCFSSKRFRSTPLASLEPIMHRFIELCVDMRKGRTAKEGLMQYKNIAQNTSVQSIEAVITRFVQLADAKVREAQEKAAVQVAVDVDDLEASETPESILLGAVSGDQSKDRTDRALTLKNNARLEVIYQTIAQQAFKFCLKHQRKVEFRRLCETLRLHLSNVAKYSHQPHSINLSDPDTLQHHLDTRFAQLNTSVELELWQEAFRSVEDVHNLLTMAKKAPRPAMMANYYEKLTKIFLMSGNALYHAAAWGRYNAALAVPVGLASAAEEPAKQRLTALLGLPKPPTRAGLLADALARDVLRRAPTSAQQLYHELEVAFDPLTLCASVAPLFATLRGAPDYAPYVPLLQRALLSRLLSQLAQVYASVRVAFIMELVEPLREGCTDGAFEPEQVESYIMGCARRGELSVRVDHADGSIAFVDDAFGDVLADAPPPTSAHEAPVQPSGSELVRTRLGRVARCLHNSLAVLDAPAPATPEAEQEKFKALAAQVHAERKALALRRALVARRRELLSELSVRKEKEEAARRADASRREKEDEARRAKDEARRRELARIHKIQEDMKAQDAERYKAALVEKGILKPGDHQNIASLDTEGLIGMQVAQLEKEKKELNERLRIVAKRVDHIERAYRKEERPLLAQDYAAQQASDRETPRATHAEDLATKARLARMLPEYEARRAVVLAKKGEEYAKKKDAAARKIEEEKAKRRKAVFAKHEEERKAADEAARLKREREEAERRKEEERLAEEERLRAEAEAALRKQREAERAEALEMARLQAQREEEAEARRIVRAAEKNAPVRKPIVPTPPSTLRASAPATNGEGVWRRGATTPRQPEPRVAKYVPGALRAAAGGAGSGWRERQEAARNASTNAGTAPARVASPAPTTDGFQTVPAKTGVWRSSRRGRA